MQLPAINLNGSDGMELARQYHEAAIAIEHAVRLMNSIIHGRDYQTAPAGALDIAQQEMRDRTKPLIAAYNDMTEAAEHCAREAR